MRKILALALALSLAVSIAVPAGAAGAEEGLYASYDTETGSLGGRIEAQDMGSVHRRERSIRLCRAGELRRGGVFTCPHKQRRAAGVRH